MTWVENTDSSRPLAMSSEKTLTVYWTEVRPADARSTAKRRMAPSRTGRRNSTRSMPMVTNRQPG